MLDRQLALRQYALRNWKDGHVGLLVPNVRSFAVERRTGNHSQGENPVITFYDLVVLRNALPHRVLDCSFYRAFRRPKRSFWYGS